MDLYETNEVIHVFKLRAASRRFKLSHDQSQGDGERYMKPKAGFKFCESDSDSALCIADAGGCRF